jgi:hypothetical protein
MYKMQNRPIKNYGCTTDFCDVLEVEGEGRQCLHKLYFRDLLYYKVNSLSAYRTKLLLLNFHDGIETVNALIAKHSDSQQNTPNKCRVCLELFRVGVHLQTPDKMSELFISWYMNMDLFRVTFTPTNNWYEMKDLKASSESQIDYTLGFIVEEQSRRRIPGFLVRHEDDILLLTQRKLLLYQDNYEWVPLENFYQQICRLEMVHKSVGLSNCEIFKQLSSQSIKLQDSTDPNIFKSEQYYRTASQYLNFRQLRAFEDGCTKSGIELIAGLFGCGKSTLLSYIVSKLILSENTRVLVTAERNIAIDEVMDKLLKFPELDKELVLRVGRTDSTASKAVICRSMDYLVQMELEKLSEEERDQNADEDLPYNYKVHGKVWKKQIQKVKVIFCTLTTAASKEMQKLQFKHVLVDESGLVTEWSLVCCLRSDMKMLLLLGDIVQNPPFSKHTLSLPSVLEILMDSSNVNNPVVHLDTQYRCHSFICSLVDVFYKYRIYTNVKYDDPYLRAMDIHGRKVGSNDASRAWMINIRGSFNTKGKCKGLSNKEEAVEVLKLLLNILNVLFQQNIQKNVKILAPYREQKSLLETMIASQKNFSQRMIIMMKAVEVQTFDGCQGTEGDIVILSLTRSGGMRTGLGFLANKVYRCVVPITRAREYLFIVGDEDLFKKDNNWREVLSKIQNRVHLEKDYL